MKLKYKKMYAVKGHSALQQVPIGGFNSRKEAEDFMANDGNYNQPHNSFKSWKDYCKFMIMEYKTESHYE